MIRINILMRKLKFKANMTFGAEIETDTGNNGALYGRTGTGFEFGQAAQKIVISLKTG